MNIYIVVVVYGMFGVLARFAIDRAFFPSSGTSPFITMGVNMIGCFLAGAIYVYGQRQLLSEELQAGLLVGFCGGFTTFSAYALYSVRLIDAGRMTPALLNFFLSPIFGIIAVLAGMSVGRLR